MDTNNITTIDSSTPIGVYLSAYYQRSFAYYTMKERVPVILTRTIDSLVRSKGEYGPENEELKTVIGEISKLKYELQTNKPLIPIKSHFPDVHFYNEYLMEQTSERGECTYFNTIWLHAECYVYRRLREIFELTTSLRDVDPFHYQKLATFKHAKDAITELCDYYITNIDNKEDCTRDEFIALLKLNLWGNKCDLSITNGTIPDVLKPSTALHDLQSMILSDASEHVWDLISSQNDSSDIIDIVFDNTGYEIVTDLWLADFLISKKLAKHVRFYVKSMPWFISDVTLNDFKWLIDDLKNNSNKSLKITGERWSSYLSNKSWEVIDDWFWTLPVDFTYMNKVKPDLYEKLSEAKLIFFKGDLNYRKLFADKNWDTTTSVHEALQGFHPSKLAILRTLKSTVVVGLKEGLADELDKTENDWRCTGKYGLIQFCA